MFLFFRLLLTTGIQSLLERPILRQHVLVEGCPKKLLPYRWKMAVESLRSPSKFSLLNHLECSEARLDSSYSVLVPLDPDPSELGFHPQPLLPDGRSILTRKQPSPFPLFLRSSDSFNATSGPGFSHPDQVPPLPQMAVEYLLGATLVFSALFAIIHGVYTFDAQGSSVSILYAVVYLLLGLFLIALVVSGLSEVLQICLAAWLVIGGISKLILAAQLRHMAASPIVLISGIVSLSFFQASSLNHPVSPYGPFN